MASAALVAVVPLRLLSLDSTGARHIQGKDRTRLLLHQEVLSPVLSFSGYLSPPASFPNAGDNWGGGGRGRRQDKPCYTAHLEICGLRRWLWGDTIMELFQSRYAREGWRIAESVGCCVAVMSERRRRLVARTGGREGG